MKKVKKVKKSFFLISGYKKSFAFTRILFNTNNRMNLYMPINDVYVQALLDDCCSDSQLIRLLWLFRDYVFPSAMWTQLKKHIIHSLLPQYTASNLHAEILKTSFITIMFGLIYKHEYIDYSFTQHSIDAAKETVTNNVRYWLERAHANLQFYRRYGLMVPSSITLAKIAHNCNQEKFQSLLKEKQFYIQSIETFQRNKALKLAHSSNQSRLSVFSHDFFNWFVHTYDSHMHPSIIFGKQPDKELTSFYANQLKPLL